MGISESFAVMSGRTSKNARDELQMTDKANQIEKRFTVRYGTLGYFREIMFAIEKSPLPSPRPLAVQLRWHRRLAYALIVALLFVRLLQP
jgi:hypothetical protein